MPTPARSHVTRSHADARPSFREDPRLPKTILVMATLLAIFGGGVALIISGLM